MDADEIYVVEHIIRDRLRSSGVLPRPSPVERGSPGATGIGHRLVELGRSLVKKARTEALAIFVRRPGTRITNRS
jgi:hypothetical protein